MLWVRLTTCTSSLTFSLKEIRNFESNYRKSRIMDFPDETRQAEKKKETEIEHNKKTYFGRSSFVSDS